MPAPPSAAPVLDRLALNRATLARQLLLPGQPAPVSVEAAVEQLYGMQSQVPLSPYVGLRTRLPGFDPDGLASLLLDRRAVRIVLMRGTVHLVAAADCLTLRPLVQPLLDRGFTGAGIGGIGAATAGMDLAELASFAAAALAGRPLNGKELGAVLVGRWPDRDPRMLVQAVRSLLPLVQVPPRGIWGQGGQPTYATAGAWLGRPLDPEPDPAAMVRRYLAACGPASVRDAQTWSGLTRLREVFDRMAPQLRTFRDEQGTVLYDLPDAPRPDPDTPVPVHYLPEYDNCLRSHADRGRLMTTADRAALATRNDAPRPILLVDGFVHGVWRITREGRTATLRVDLFRSLPAPEATAAEAAGARLLAFVEPDADTHAVRFTERA